MKTKKNITKALLSTAVVGVAFAPVMAQAGGTETVNPVEQSAELIGTFESTTLDVSIPATATFIYDPDTGKSTAQELDIISKTNAVLTMNSKSISVSPISEWKPSLVLPFIYSDAKWSSLTSAQTEESIALGVVPVEFFGWNGKASTTVWSDSSSRYLGEIKPKSFVKVLPDIKAGTSMKSPKVLTSNYVFEFSLY